MTNLKYAKSKIPWNLMRWLVFIKQRLLRLFPQIFAFLTAFVALVFFLYRIENLSLNLFSKHTIVRILQDWRNILAPYRA